MHGQVNHRLRVSALALVGALTLVHALRAHDIPSDVTVQVYIKPEDQKVRLLVRAPLAAMRDMTWPLRARDVLDIGRADAELRNAATLWLGDESSLYATGGRSSSPTVAAVRASPPGSRAFERYETALALVSGPREPDASEISVREGFLDVVFEYPVSAGASGLSFEPRWGRLGIKAVTLIRFVQPDGTIRTFTVEGDPGLIRLDPTWGQTVRAFAARGFQQMVESVDVVLLLGCLIAPFRRMADAATIGVAFVVAQAMTLVAAFHGFAPDALWYQPFVEMLGAGTLLYAAVENIIGVAIARRWRVGFVCGLIHGFGLSFALARSLQFAGAHTFVSIASFAAGAAAAQLALVAACALMLVGLFRLVVTERLGIVLLSALIGHTGWHAFTNRTATLWRYQLPAPTLSAASLADMLRWLMLAVIAAGVMWLGSVMLKPRSG